jgi:hypothetical protein
MSDDPHGGAAMRTTPSAALARLLTGTLDARPIALVRIVIGLTALARAVEARRIFARLFLPTTIRLPYVAGLPSLPADAVPWLLALWVAAALGFALGWFTRTAGVVLAAILFYVVLLDEQTYSNHLYLLTLVVLLLVLAGAGAAYSLDARGCRDGAGAQAWAVWLLRTQVSAVYAFAGLSKINRTYLSGATMAAYMSPDVLLSLPEASRLPFVLACSWGAIVLELGLAVALWRRRWRAAAVVVGAALHVGMVALLPAGVRVQLAIFAIEMLALYLAFFDPAGIQG